MKRYIDHIEGNLDYAILTTKYYVNYKKKKTLAHREEKRVYKTHNIKKMEMEKDGIRTINPQETF